MIYILNEVHLNEAKEYTPNGVNLSTISLNYSLLPYLGRRELKTLLSVHQYMTEAE